MVVGDGRTTLLSISAFFSREERDGRMADGTEVGIDPSYQALGRLLAGLR